MATRSRVNAAIQAPHHPYHSLHVIVTASDAARTLACRPPHHRPTRPRLRTCVQHHPLSNLQLITTMVTPTASQIGFDFSNYARNEFLGARTALPKGTSSMAVVQLRNPGRITDTQRRRLVLLSLDSSLAAVTRERRRVSASARTRVRRLARSLRTRIARRCVVSSSSGPEGRQLNLLTPDPLPHPLDPLLRSRYCR